MEKRGQAFDEREAMIAEARPSWPRSTVGVRWKRGIEGWATMKSRGVERSAFDKWEAMIAEARPSWPRSTVRHVWGKVGAWVDGGCSAAGPARLRAEGVFAVFRPCLPTSHRARMHSHACVRASACVHSQDFQAPSRLYRLYLYMRCDNVLATPHPLFFSHAPCAPRPHRPTTDFLVFETSH
jgi:hypothetical protein